MDLRYRGDNGANEPCHKFIAHGFPPGIISVPNTVVVSSIAAIIGREKVVAVRYMECYPECLVIRDEHRCIQSKGMPLGKIVLYVVVLGVSQCGIGNGVSHIDSKFI